MRRNKEQEVSDFLTDYPPHWGGPEPGTVSIGYRPGYPETRHETHGLVTAREKIAELSCAFCKFIVYIYDGDDLNKRPAEWLRLHRKQCHKGE